MMLTLTINISCFGVNTVFLDYKTHPHFSPKFEGGIHLIVQKNMVSEKLYINNRQREATLKSVEIF